MIWKYISDCVIDTTPRKLNKHDDDIDEALRDNLYPHFLLLLSFFPRHPIHLIVFFDWTDAVVFAGTTIILVYPCGLP